MARTESTGALALAALVGALGCGNDSGERATTSVGPATAGDASSASGVSGVDDGDITGGDDAASTGDDPVVPAGVRTLELAGHSRDDAPSFRWVQDFADDAAIELGVDPSRVPDLVGTTCDAWVVAAKTGEQWTQDAALVDVRAGGPQEVTIGMSLADAHALVGAGELSSDAGASLGVAYDVVLDCNRNAALDDGDVVDGGEAPGLWRVGDASAVGPLAVAVFNAYASMFLDERTFYPADIATMGELPLVVVTHGWAYNHTYYDYIGEHLASYGYIVMLHEAEVGDGDEAGTLTAAQTTLDNLEDLLANTAEIGGGVLVGHIDTHRIMLTGHSTGGEAVVRALTMLREGAFSSVHFGYDDIRVVSSMAPVSWHPRTKVDPGEVPYHMFVAGADDDVSGAPELSYTQCRSIYERARGDRQLTYIHGAGHGDLLDCCGELFIDTTAPDLIGREATKVVARGYFLALAERYLRDNPAALEFFTRPFADFHPSGIAGNVVVTLEHHEQRAVVLDDFQTAAGLDVASSGGTATFDVANAAEVLMRDNDGSFAWAGDQPSNGLTHARHDGDDPHALVFDWSSDAYYEHAVAADFADFNAYEFVSLRVAQGTRHPETVALAGPLSFTITLRDGAGATGSIAVTGASAIPPPYARDGFGAGVGWQSEFVTVRVRLDELAAEGRVDLGDIEAIRLELGASHGSPRGRVAIDDLELIPRAAP